MGKEEEEGKGFNSHGIPVMMQKTTHGSERLHSAELFVVYPWLWAGWYDHCVADGPAAGAGPAAGMAGFDIPVLCSNGITISADGCPKRLANCLNSCRNLCMPLRS